ncbi:hypothetical protein [Agarivorans sp. JK6]|uniref:hypothetical protein n=1 Tax=Agarivorans sp. JK6 TaxID=2997426 RepID=UPI00387337E0
MGNENEDPDSWFDLSQAKSLDSFHKVFVNGWDYLLVSPQFLLDEDNYFQGIEVLSKLDKSKTEDELHFHLTMFADFEEPNWTEQYSAKSLMLSDKEQWQLVYAGMFFYPTQKDWCGIYIDVECQDVVVLGAKKQLIKRIQETFPPSSILTIEYIKQLLNRRYEKQES